MVMGQNTQAGGGTRSTNGGAMTTDDGWMRQFLAMSAGTADFIRQACSDRIRTLLARGTSVVATALFGKAFVWDDETRDWVETPPWATNHIDEMVQSLRSSR